MSLVGNKARLVMLSKEISNQWDQTKENWRDAKSLEFEQQFMEELLPSVDKTVTVIDQLDKLISQIRKDCE